MGDVTPDDVLNGYLDGFRSGPEAGPPGPNRSELYRFGWANGRDDRKRMPRASAETIRAEGERLWQAIKTEGPRP